MNTYKQLKPFITFWEVKSSGDGIKIPVNDRDYKYYYTVDWGDGSKDIKVYTEDAYHIYDKPGIYKVKISGIFPHIYFYNASQYIRDRIISVDQWGDQDWKSMRRSFYKCKNIKILAKDSPDLSNVKNMSSMFDGTHSFNQNIGSWDVSSVTDMSYMFYNSTSFNKPLNSWDVSSVTDMSFMFYNATSFNQPIGSWDVSSVTDMSGMFYIATSFNKPISSWNIFSVTKISFMFNSATSFNQDISSWDFSSVTKIFCMFYNNIYFNKDITFLLKLLKKSIKSNAEYNAEIIRYMSLNIQNYKKIFSYNKECILGKVNVILKTINHE